MMDRHFHSTRSRWTRWVTVSLALATLVLTSLSLAETQLITISKQRIMLGDVVATISDSLATIDLGSAPPPGRNRLLTRREITLKLRTLGIAASTLSLPASVRVQSEAKQYSTSELERLVKEAVVAELPLGVTLHSLQVHSPQVLSPSVRAGRVRLPRFSMRAGEQRGTSTVELVWGDQIVLRLPVQLHVELGQEVLSQGVRRGATLTLAIVKGPVSVSTLAQALSNGRVGEVISLRIMVTRKVVNARLVSPDRAELVI